MPMLDDRYRRPTSIDSLQSSPTGERLAVLAAELSHVIRRQEAQTTRIERLEDRFEQDRQDRAVERQDRATREQIKLQEKEARKGAMSAGLALLSLLMFLMAAVNFVGPRLPGTPPPNSAAVHR